MKRVEVEQTRRIFDDFFQIEEAHLRYEKFDGQMSPLVRRLNFERGDSVAALLFNPRTRRLLLASQFKYPTYAKGPGWITELVAGMIDPGETPESALRREVLEETGYRLDRVEPLSTFYVSPGGTSERIVLFYGEFDESGKVGAGGGLAAENEDIAVVELGIEEALKQIESGEIVDAKTIIGILWLQRRLEPRREEDAR